MASNEEVKQTLEQADYLLEKANTESVNMGNIDLWLYSLAFAIFGLISMLLVAFLIYKDKDPWSCIRCIGTITIIVMAGLLVIGGYSPEQISAVIGLLGTIAGYMLGKTDGSK